MIVLNGIVVFSWCGMESCICRGGRCLSVQDEMLKAWDVILPSGKPGVQVLLVRSLSDV